jgi:5-methylcytosine-specific restriction endonuclease McrA
MQLTPKPWFKVWTYWLHDPAMLRLKAAEEGAWFSLYTLAHVCGQEGKITYPSGKPIEKKVILQFTHIHTLYDRRAYSSMVKKMIESGWLRYDGDILLVVRYKEEQSAFPRWQNWANSYGLKLKDPRWQKKRLHILERDHWTCQDCLDTESTLEVHHTEYLPNTEPWDYPDELLVTLCEKCHEKYREAADG